MKLPSSFIRFGLTGIVFTILGPSLFWLAYPLGPLVAIGIAEVSIHMLRYAVFREFVFPRNRGYRVSVPRYIASALPVTITGLISVALLQHQVGRLPLTLINAFLAVVVGFLWSRYVYSKPVAGR